MSKHTHADGCCPPGAARKPGWRGILPTLAVCAVCPACLGIWAAVLPAAIVGKLLTPEIHGMLTGAALAVAWIFAWRAFRSGGSRVAFALSLGGIAAIAVSQLAGDIEWMEWSGVAALLGATLYGKLSAVWTRRPIPEPAR